MVSVSEVTAEVPSKVSGMATVVCPAVIAVVKVAGVKLELELAIKNVVVPTVASVRPTVRVVLCAVPLLVNALALRTVVVQFNEGDVVGVTVSSFFLQEATAKTVRTVTQDQMDCLFIVIRMMICSYNGLLYKVHY